MYPKSLASVGSLFCTAVHKHVEDGHQGAQYAEVPGGDAHPCCQAVAANLFRDPLPRTLSRIAFRDSIRWYRGYKAKAKRRPGARRCYLAITIAKFRVQSSRQGQIIILTYDYSQYKEPEAAK